MRNARLSWNPRGYHSLHAGVCGTGQRLDLRTATRLDYLPQQHCEEWGYGFVHLRDANNDPVEYRFYCSRKELQIFALELELEIGRPGQPLPTKRPPRRGGHPLRRGQSDRVLRRMARRAVN
jgi:hypothetical protein